MALIKCPECREKVSNQSDRCIKCGYPLRRKTPCLASMKLDMIEKNMQKLQNSLAKETDANDDENPITTHLFKMGIVFVLVFVFLAFLLASIKNAIEAFATDNVAITINFVVHILITGLLVLIYVLSKKENPNSKYAEIVSKILKVSMMIIGFYIALNAASCFFVELYQDGKLLLKYFTFQMLFSCSGLILIPMIQEVLQTKDKNYIMSYIALILTIVFAVIQK